LPFFNPHETTPTRPDEEMCYRARMGASLAELVVLAAAVWLIARGLEPLRRRMERTILRLIAPDRADIVDADIIPPNKKRKE
jgi:hypothetical protein